jgi:putative flippase GtrA
VAFGAVTLFNSWANRRFTFGHRGRVDRGTHLLRLAVTFLVGITATVLVAILAHGPLWRESLALLAVWLPLAAFRFALLRTWVFRPKVHPLLLDTARPSHDPVTKG